MKRLVLRLSFAAALACGANASASQFSVAASGSTFTISRDDASAAETVRYRTVSRSALAGAHRPLRPLRRGDGRDDEP